MTMPYTGYHPGDPDPLYGTFWRWVLAIVAVVLLALVLVGCGPTAEEKPVVQAPPASPKCFTAEMAKEAKAMPHSELKDAPLEHLRGTEAKKFMARVTGGAPATLTDIILIYLGDDEVRVIFFDRGCAVHMEDVSKSDLARANPGA